MLSKTKWTIRSRAPKAREENLSILREIYTKAQFCGTAFDKKHRKQAVRSDNPPRSLEQEHAVFACHPKHRQQDARERRRRERGQFATFYARFTQKCTFAVPFAALRLTKVHNTSSTCRMFQSHSPTNTSFLRPFRKKRETGARERRMRERP